MGDLGIADGGGAADLADRTRGRRGPETLDPRARARLRASHLIHIGAADALRGRLLSRAVGRVAQRLIDAAPARARVGGRGGVGPASDGIHLIQVRHGGAETGATRLPARAGAALRGSPPRGSGPAALPPKPPTRTPVVAGGTSVSPRRSPIRQRRSETWH